MSLRQVAQATDGEVKNIVHDRPEVFSDHDHVMMGEEEFDSFRFLFIRKTDGIEPRPGQAPFLGLHWAKGDHRNRRETVLHATGRFDAFLFGEKSR